MKQLFLFALLLIGATPLFAADSNGYTAQYECRTGGPNCNIDVAGMAGRSCDQVITPSTSPTNNWSAINWSNQVICIQAGDHTGRGELNLGSSGSSGSWKILRYYRSGDTDDDPWNQSDANRAKVLRINGNGKSYWLIQRLTLPSVQTTEKVYLKSREDHIILNRTLAEGFHGNSEGAFICDGCSNVTIQNSVIRNCGHDVGWSPVGILFGGSTNFHAVNNEVYDCAKQIFTWQTGGSETGAVVENNDLYLSPAYYTNCAGSITSSGNCSMAESVWSTKSQGTSASPFIVLHNRMWGLRPCDTSLACDGGGAAGGLFSIGGGANEGRYVLLQNNIFADAEQAGEFNTQIPTGTAHNSVVGNIMYHFRTYRYDVNSLDVYACCGSGNDSTEMYLNTIIDAKPATSGWLGRGGGTNFDVRCNVAIDSNPATGSWGSGSQMDSNGYYGMAASGETNKVVSNLVTRANSTSYSVGTIIRTGPASSCSSATDTACFLYQVTAAGQSASSSPGYCTTLGCTTVDGGVTVMAVRGPYTYYRKLKTTRELNTIPYATAYAGAPEARSCPSNYASRSGIGINDAP